MPNIVPVVEGPGDLQATPILLRKILHEQFNRFDIGVARPKRANGKGNLKRDLERFVNYAALTHGCVGILVLSDADDECALGIVEDFCARCRHLGLAFPICIVCAVRDYEAWFLASLDTIKCGPNDARSVISATAAFTGSAESMHGVKAWLGRQMPPGRAYRETTDQAAFTALIDIPTALANSRSFRRLSHAVEELIVAIDSGVSVVSPFAGKA